jgi:hypothetical protein
MGDVDMDVDMEVVDPQLDVEDVRNMAVDSGEAEIEDLDTGVLDEMPEDDTGEVEAVSEDGNTVVVV